MSLETKTENPFEIKGLDPEKEIVETSVNEEEEVSGLDEDTKMVKIYFIDNPDNKVEVRYSSIKFSGLIKTMAETDEEEDEFPIATKCSPDLLDIFIKYMDYHEKTGHHLEVDSETKEVTYVGVKKPVISSDHSENVIDKWDSDFVDNDIMLKNIEHKDNKNIIGKKRLYEMIGLANFMDVQSLLHLCSSKMACMIKGKTLEEIKKITDENEPL
jgi:hypothetical protein